MWCTILLLFLYLVISDLAIGQVETIVRTSDAIECLREPRIQETLKRLRSREKRGGNKIQYLILGVHFKKKCCEQNNGKVQSRVEFKF